MIWNYYYLNNFEKIFTVISINILLFMNLSCTQILGCLHLTENNRPVLFCQNSIPLLPLTTEEIPNNIAKLRIIGTTIPKKHNGILTHYNLTGLESLIYLEIANFDLEVIESHAFKSMKQLRVLDLSKNHLVSIRSNAFNSLSLELLSLNDNKGLKFDELSFTNTKIFHLVVRNCDLTELDYNLVAEAQIKQFSLSDNQLTWLDPRFGDLIMDSTTNLIESTHNLNREMIGYIDLSNNPLNCNCQLMWLSKLIETQLYNVHKHMKHEDNQINKKDIQSNSPIRLMYQMNMTCKNPSKLTGKTLPNSWEYYCPQPIISGIELNLIDKNLIQLVCIGKGKPIPNIAWKYNLNGQQIQQILDSTNKPINQLSNYNKYYSNKQSSNENMNELIEQRFTLNVSLPLSMENFTCTVWNNDNFQMKQFDNNQYESFSTLSSSSKTLDYMKTTSLIVPSTQFEQPLPYYRLQELTVRITGPLKFINSLMMTNKIENSKSTPNSEQIIPILPSTNTKTNSGNILLIHELNNETYSYLFIKRFTLLELIGAVIGTFITTLALLYLATNCLSWFCQFNNLSNKSVRKSHFRSSNKWFLWTKNNNNDSNNNALLLRSNNQSTGSNTSQCPNLKSMDSNLLQRADVDTDTSFMDMTTTPMLSKFASTTISTGRPNIPQALLLTNVPAPPLDRNSTPPPNPTYWPMPEYTYSGTGSHEYDVPKPIETFVNDKRNIRNGLIEPLNVCPSTAQSFLTVANQSLFPINGNSIQRLENGMQSSTTIPSLWTQNVNTTNNNNNNNLSILNQLIGWTPNLMNTGTLINTTDRQTHSGSYTGQTPAHSIIYSGDYPTYLQTRPYPHHNQTQTLLEYMNNTLTRNYLLDKNNLQNFLTATENSLKTQNYLKSNGISQDNITNTNTTNNNNQLPTHQTEI